MIWNSSKSVNSIHPCFWQCHVLKEKKKRTYKLKGKLYKFKVTKTHGRLENPSAFLASFASGRGSPRTPFDRLGHLDQCQRVLGKADTLLSRGEKGHFWLLFRHFKTQASVVKLIFQISRMSFDRLALYRELEPSKLHGDAGMLCQDFGQDFFQ